VTVQSPAAGTVTSMNVTIRGQVLDNLSGVKLLELQIDTGPFATISFDANGNFTVPTALALTGSADGAHTLRFRATDAAGNMSTPLEFPYILDTQAPTLAITSPAANATVTAGSHLTGTVSGTGSAVTSLAYAVVGGPAYAVSFDSASGAFDQALDLSRVASGSHSLVVTARDAAGLTTMRTLGVNMPNAVPLAVTDYAPQNGADDVGATYRPKVTFSRAINRATLNGNNFYAVDSTGTKLPATIVPSDDGTFAWLFPTNSMPGGSTVTVTVDGSTILAADGAMLDASGNGTAGSKLTFRFTTVSLANLPGTSLSGVVADPGPDLKPMTFDDLRAGPDGVLMTSDDAYLNPIAHAKVYILGEESQFVYTDSQGRFSFASVPSGDIKLAIDGRTATNAPAGYYFPEMVMDLTIRPGQANTVMGGMGTREEQQANAAIPGLYLPRLATSILQAVSNTAVTTIGVDTTSAPNLTPVQRQFLKLDVQPGSLIGPDGQPMATGQVGISTVPPELVRDMLPSGLLQHTFDITVQAPGISTFSTPVSMTSPNVFNAAPGQKLNLLSFDHTTGRLVIEGTGTVSMDGLSVRTDPGTGITHPGWHGWTPPGVQQSVRTSPSPPPPPKNQLRTYEFGFEITGSLKSIGLEFDAIFPVPGQLSSIDYHKDFLSTEFPLSVSRQFTFTSDKNYNEFHIPLFGIEAAVTATLGGGISGTAVVHKDDPFADLGYTVQLVPVSADISVTINSAIPIGAAIPPPFGLLLSNGFGFSVDGPHEPPVLESIKWPVTPVPTSGPPLLK
jgi:hypothetical protein